jgi:hypothetical protein|tara:strand:- start:26411 stop:28081 length:1671 start_codon:yes stop_codon:yes gene_type:complete
MNEEELDLEVEWNEDEEELQRFRDKALLEEELQTDWEITGDEKYDSRIPKLINEFVSDCNKVVKYNKVPSSIMFLTLLGQTVKDFVAIPNGTGFHEDSRLHFCWIQTSGTGKSALMNFVLPISRKVWDGINEIGAERETVTCFDGDDNIVFPNIFTGEYVGENLRFNKSTDNEPYRENHLIPAYEPYEQYTNFDVVEYTAAALVGHQKEHEKIDEDGNEVTEFKWLKGELDGNGLARWDEFTNSGVFGSANHKDGIVTYLNTMMNTIHGESWIITKTLKDGPIVRCQCQRSIIATTFPPKQFAKQIADTGLFQRMILYIWEVPEKIQNNIRNTIVDNIGIVREEELPIDKYADKLIEIYKLTRIRCKEVGDDVAKTVTFSDEFRVAMRQAKDSLNALPDSTTGIVREISKNFLTRLIITMGKISVLCCLAETLDRKEEDRFIVTVQNVVQAREIVHNCYKSLVEWLELSLKVERATLLQKTQNKLFFDVYDGLLAKEDTAINGENGFVNKNLLFEIVAEKAEISDPQTYVRWRVVEDEFITGKISRTKYVKKKGEE